MISTSEVKWSKSDENPEFTNKTYLLSHHLHQHRANSFYSSPQQHNYNSYCRTLFVLKIATILLWFSACLLNMFSLRITNTHTSTTRFIHHNKPTITHNKEKKAGDFSAPAFVYNRCPYIEIAQLTHTYTHHCDTLYAQRMHSYKTHFKSHDSIANGWFFNIR